MTVTSTDAVALVGACASPAEAFWRLYELDILRTQLPLQEPVIELGCGDGVFTATLGVRVDLGVDRQANAVTRAAAHAGTYRRVIQRDLRTLDGAALGTYATVFSNSVLEHVPHLGASLEGLRTLVAPGGALVTTVPLADMNEHLACRHRRYQRWRQRQLEHRNLWTEAEWREHLSRAGFRTVTFSRYLVGEACRCWDRLDVGGTLGFGRYRVAAAAHRLARRLPRPIKDTLKAKIACSLLARSRRSSPAGGCAALIVARAAPEGS